MKNILNTYDTKTHLSRTAECVTGGEAIAIANAGKPVAKIVPLDEEKTASNRIGFLSGQIKVLSHFNDMDTGDICAIFEETGQPDKFTDLARSHLEDSNHYLFFSAARLLKKRGNADDCPR